MIVDTSALIAILRDEPEASVYAQAIEDAPVRRVSAANFLETANVIDGSRDPVASRRLDESTEPANGEPEAADALKARLEKSSAQARIAREAYRDFGKGSGHPASLNFGDCFAYALAKSSGEPLLFKGDDFGHSDVTPALSS